ncbi:SDR family oxidoreductase [Actinosynnema pretiosum subsp. pretiosum]|uniref:SDR family oxidoreductase n=1 Tax=Actinosynnema pretiosum subsp. pretiosum TaxID=103721 RepID=A0AA45L636_9PSEU|nr:SDR family oxidoreductase [Actinosynnema mirum]AXX32542.1 3-oxoacyl-[acyl-carrier protein] reductase [Actinosynnema pretiosum subsp. pretiosum]QUF03553.1 SDR family oxidoreductase [Actinosynnema pretiosum subsp. pretiosum]
MNEQRTALVTGANKGIGYAIAAGLGALGHRVGVGARDDARREEAVARLRAEGVDAFGVPLDVTDDTSVAAAARQLEEAGHGLDVLVNNAGISGDHAPDWSQDPTALDLAEARRVVETNVFGVVRVTNALLPLLRRSASPRVVNISSSVASLTRQADPDAQSGPVMAVYAPTKSYLNALTVQYARQLAGTGVLVNAACPGLVATDFTGFQAPRTPEQGAVAALRLATLPDGGPSGGFFDDEGALPW